MSKPHGTPPPMAIIEAIYFTAHDLMMLLQSPIGAVLRPTPSSLILMRAIDNAGHPMTIAHIAERMGYSTQNASAVVRRLINYGWLHLASSEGAKHDKAVELTERGLWVLDTAMDRVGGHVAEVTSMLSSTKRKALLRYLERVSNAAGRKDPGMDPIALGRGELGKPEKRDELEERNRRAYLAMVKMSRTWGVTLDELRKFGYHVPDPPGTKKRTRAPPPPPPKADDKDDIGDAFWNSDDDDL